MSKIRKPRPSDGNKTSLSISPEDRAVFARLGVTPGGILKAWAARYRDAESRTDAGSAPDKYDTDGMTPEEIDELVDPKAIEIRPTQPHGWSEMPGRWIARAPSIDDAVRLRDEMRGRGGDARLAAPYVLLVAEVTGG